MQLTFSKERGALIKSVDNRNTSKNLSKEKNRGKQVHYIHEINRKFKGPNLVDSDLLLHNTYR